MTQPVSTDTDTLRRLIREEMTDVLSGVGIHTDDAVATRADMAHLRAWREATEKIKDAGLAATVKWFVVAVLGLIAVGLAVKFGLPGR